MFRPHPEAERIFSEALRLAGQKRDAFVSDECANDSELYRQVRALLAADTDARSFLESPLSPADEVADADTDDPLVGQRIDRYTLIGRIGAGGMGTVYEARQERPHRRVALKILRPSLLSPAMRRRFRLEAQVLGLLDHPHIAKVHDAGAYRHLGHELPYLAMEYIADAETQTDYARKADLSIARRLELFAAVCDAVQHGHQRGVIHRDLKPANILVTPDGQPKIIDFGVARVTDADVTLMTRQTATSHLIGTLRYMSPEQCTGISAKIDTRSDVYALGVVLFELLTGAMPYDLASVTPFEAPRIIREESPTRLSTIAPQLRGDLDVIVAKALEKDSERRYATAAALADDIRRYLRSEPIVARPASRVYQARMFVRRHREGVTLVALLFAVLTAGLAVSAVLYHRSELARIDAERERDRAHQAESEARRRREESDAVLGFLAETMLAADPGTTAGKELSVRDALDRAAAKTHDAFADQPLTEAAVHTMLGKVYTRTGRFEEAAAELVTAMDLLRAHADPNEPALGDALFELAALRWNTGQHAEAEKLLRESVAIAEANHGEMSETVAERVHALAAVLTSLDKDAEAESLLRRAIAIREKLLGKDHPSLSACYNGLAVLKRKAGDYAAAEPLFVKALTLTRLEHGEISPYVAIAHLNLGEVCAELGRPDDAEQHLRSAVDILKQVYDDQHQMVPIALEKLAAFLADQKRFDEALTTQQQAVEVWASFRGPDHASTINAQNVLKEMQIDKGE